MVFNITALIHGAGYLGLFGIIFAESGLLVGFFLPGDTLLFSAGVLASRGFLDIRILAPLLFAAAVLGDNLGYFIGRRLGPAVFKREDSIFFHKKNAGRAEDFFGKYGARAVIFGRFIPVIRTFMPVVAGVGKMPYRAFAAFDAIGGFLWAVLLTLAGYFFGGAIPNIDAYLLPIVLGILAVSLAPWAIGLIRLNRTGGQ